MRRKNDNSSESEDSDDEDKLEVIQVEMNEKLGDVSPQSGEDGCSFPVRKEPFKTISVAKRESDYENSLPAIGKTGIITDVWAVIEENTKTSTERGIMAEKKKPCVMHEVRADEISANKEIADSNNGNAKNFKIEKLSINLQDPEWERPATGLIKNSVATLIVEQKIKYPTEKRFEEIEPPVAVEEVVLRNRTKILAKFYLKTKAWREGFKKFLRSAKFIPKIGSQCKTKSVIIKMDDSSQDANIQFENSTNIEICVIEPPRKVAPEITPKELFINESSFLPRRNNSHNRKSYSVDNYSIGNLDKYCTPDYQYPRRRIKNDFHSVTASYTIVPSLTKYDEYSILQNL
ncbi:uncharacterized protein LOC129779734 [Toxorhynchites rutilus septentrionalis]|uniref:uncharacterized protein LOC129779734 n=1 Tax=Toxorhynchites rutilus septentrionalis TaxID=329112 RepID=UPI00247AE73E|nr:uncharacterized protein LOC129779734 [Toxorhynchites rutilus septentrionalis]